jgi:hypothetical protein
MNEHVAYFNRFAKSYLRWSHFNMDRIVADAISKAKAELKQEREEARLAPFRKQMVELFSRSNLYFDKLKAEEANAFNFYRDVAWGTMKIPPGTELFTPNRIGSKLPPHERPSR